MKEKCEIVKTVCTLVAITFVGYID